MIVDNVKGPLGALFIGGLVAAVFAGVVLSQAFAYFRLYPNDLLSLKILAGVVWILDVFHTILVTATLWDHLIPHSGQGARIDYVPWSLALNPPATALLTFLVHLFLIHRIFILSYKKLISVPLAIFSFARVCLACITGTQLFELPSITRFTQRYAWCITSGLALSCGLDILITALLCLFLFKTHSSTPVNHFLDKLMLYTFECGVLTCGAALTSLICWLTNRTNLAFIGVYFVISKLYASSFFATLNALLVNDFQSTRKMSFSLKPAQSPISQELHIRVDRTKTTVSDSTLSVGKGCLGTNSENEMV